MLHLGISQISGGSKTSVGGYADDVPDAEDSAQFDVNDRRTLDEVARWLMEMGYIPSFCTACYRLGRTGEHFMEFSVPGFIKRYCTPNAILTLSEYLVDYATPEVAAKGWKVIENNLCNVDEQFRDELLARIERIKKGERDLYF